MTNGKHWKIKDTSKMHHEAWNKGIKTGLIPSSAFKNGHPAPETAFKKGLESWNAGTTGIMKANSGSFKKGHNIGESNLNWKGGITPDNVKIRQSAESRLWVQLVFARDNYTCQKTNVKGGKLTSHHIQNFASFPELRFAVDNGITLSIQEHKKFHKIYGIKNNTREQLDAFLAREEK